jgi:hypothetical protein
MDSQLARMFADMRGVPYRFQGTTGFDCSELVKATIEAGEFTTDLVTVPNIELLEVGEDWDTFTGKFTWEPEDLLSAIASQEDPGVRAPVVKLGHEDYRFNPAEDDAPKALGGQPAFGRIVNLRVENNGNTLTGDLAGVPRWLAEIMPTAYPRRSIEGYFQYTTRTGNTWPFALTACALLGTKYPAINTLEDLKILWGGTPPPLIEVSEEDAPAVAASADGLIRARRVEPVAKVKTGKVPGLKEVKAAQEVKATTTTSDIQREWYASLESGQMWWWIRQVLVNPLQLVVDDDEGGLYLVDVSVDASDNITYAEPQPVKIEYVAASQGNGDLVAAHQDGQIVVASYGEATASGGKVKAAESGDDDDEEDSGVSKLSDDAIRALGLDPSKATDDEISAAVLAKLGQQNDNADEADDDEDDDTEDDASDSADDDSSDDASDDTNPPAGDQPGTPQQQTTPDGVVMVDQEQWAEVQQEVAASRAERKKRSAQERSDYIAAAVKAGKFPRSRAAHYEKLMAADPKGTRIIIDGLEPGLVPVQKVGQDGDGDAQGGEVAAAYPDAWKRDPRVVRARNSVSTRLKVVND